MEQLLGGVAYFSEFMPHDRLDADAPCPFTYPHGEGRELLTDTAAQRGAVLDLERWGVKVITEEQG